MTIRLNLVLTGFLLVSGCAFGGPAYTYTTAGCFSPGFCDAATGDAVAGLFDFAVPGQLDAELLYTATSVSGSSPFLNLGSLTFIGKHAGSSAYVGTFDLAVMFSVPAGTTGTPFVADVTGSVTGGAGSATVTFNPTTENFSFPGGAFGLLIAPAKITVDSTTPVAPITAQGVAPTPEPEYFGLVVAALSLLALCRRKAHLSRA